jgi:formyl-CoA transferase
MPKPPVFMSQTPPAMQGQAGRIGEHTREVLRETGYADADIDDLIAKGLAKQA